MTITFIPKANIKEIEVEGYGKVRVRPYGAGEELQISKNIRELESLQKQAEGLLADAKAEYGSDEAKLPEDFKTNFEKIQAKVRKYTDELHCIIRSTISSEQPKVAERIFNELSMPELRRLISTAMKDDNAETK